MIPLLVAGASAWLAVYTTQRVSRYGATGMTAGMAAMMAAMGTGLAAGYAAGMVWDLAWATLIGVVAGFGHGLWMGRRYGPMAALDGAGGGVMGGLMGPMLAIMLIALPLGLVWTAGLMLLVQWVFSVGAVYLVAAAAGQASGSLLAAVGRILGAESARGAQFQDHYATLGVAADATTAQIAEAFLATSRVATGEPEQLASAREALAVLSDPLRRVRYDAARLAEAECCPPESPESPERSAARPRPRAGRRAARSGGRPTAAAPAQARRPALGTILAFGGVAAALGAAYVARSVIRDSEAGARAADFGPVEAPVGPDGVQQVSITLQAPYYSPSVTEVKRGMPARLTLSAVGEPG